MLGLLGSRLWRRLAATLVAASVLPILGAGFLTTRLLEESVRDDAAVRERALADLAGSLVRDFVARGHEKMAEFARRRRERFEKLLKFIDRRDVAAMAEALDRLNRIMQKWRGGSP